MANTYDVSTVVSRSYISEQLQDQMQKGAENRNAEFVAQFQKESEKKGAAVAKAENSSGSRPVKADDKKEKNKKKKDDANKKSLNSGDNKIDIQA